MNKLLTRIALAFTVIAPAASADAAVVCRLDPYGDNYLSLRNGPGTDFPEITRLGPGTGLSIIDVAGAWLRVQTENGAQGFVSSRYVCGQ